MLYEANMYFANASINALHAKTYIVHVCNLHAECAGKTDVVHASDNMCNLSHAVNVDKADTIKQNADCEVGVSKYIAHIAESNSDYFACVKLIANRYRYVVYKLHEKGLKTNVARETGCLKSHELKRSVLDLVRLAQTSYFGNENVHMISKHGYAYALSHCKKVYRAKLLELKCLLPFFDHNDRVLRVGGRIVKGALPTEMIHQCILPRKHFVTKYSVLHEHKVFYISWERGIKSVKHVLSALLYNGLAGLPALKCRLLMTLNH